ncbi:uncharacterized protein I303_103576 [Kwoniella dejecticola CBS 10117]|uniref:GPI mannosyltransferase 1 n=1 Tax=Kwoniella dejecticola CBS 10117 TaxID=1296121 RepID=A0A1A6A751_9TREE|nr:uncharacterized protein I303_03598 [Kwoniella dejecticola CBS 10117]OBR85884.1 hypothetical protein I303_03598 [Kwoniella dejecticola CBS 10117]
MSSAQVSIGPTLAARGDKADRRVKTAHLLTLSAIIQVALLIYAQHVDTHPERYGGLRYTDVDWRVVLDGTRLIFCSNEGEGNLPRGWSTSLLGFKIGDPYERSTFRYTPLLPLLVSPSLLHPLIGRLILVGTSLIIPALLLRLPVGIRPGFWTTHLIWTLNPFVLNINTRGSPESIICLLVILTLYNLRRGREVYAAIWLGISISWKIYPIIYVAAIWSHLSRKYGSFGRGVWKFGFATGLTLLVVNGLLWSIWGQPFLQHTFLYHLTRLDHRHNFSPYFYPIYLSLFPSGDSIPSIVPQAIEKILRHPLTSFLPQTSLVLLAGFALERKAGLEFTMFVQTSVFVIFNKVCTSQYFMWFLPLLPLVIPHLRLDRTKTAILIGAWVAGQAVWLSIGYRLEFMAQGVFLYLWMAGLALFGVSCWVLGEILDGFVLRRGVRRTK